MRATITAGRHRGFPRARLGERPRQARGHFRRNRQGPRIYHINIKNMNATPDYSTGEAWMKQLKEQYAEMNKVLTDLIFDRQQ